MKPTLHDKVVESPTSTYWFDTSGILCVVLKPNAINIDERKKLMNEFRQEHNNKIYCGLVDISLFTTQDKELRRFNAQELPHIFKAIAFISPSALGNMAANIYLGLSKAVPFQTFQTEEKAREWLKRYL